MVRVAIAGAGSLGHRWTEIVQQAEGTSLVAFVDPLIGTQQAPAWLQDHAQVPQVTSLASLDLALDAVIVTAQSPAHAAAVRAALERGWHVLVEKPFATSLEDAKQLVALAQAQRRTLMVSQNYRFFPGPQRILGMVRADELGPIRSVSGQFWCDWPGKPYQHAMRHPMSLEMAIHHFDLVRAMFKAEPVQGRVQEWNPAETAYLFGGGALEALFEMSGAGGDRFPFLYSGSLVSKSPATPWGGLWRFEFDRETLFADELTGSYVLRRGSNNEILGEFGDASMAFAKSWSHFTECLRSDQEPCCSGRDNLGTLRMALSFF